MRGGGNLQRGAACEGKSWGLLNKRREQGVVGEEVAERWNLQRRRAIEEDTRACEGKGVKGKSLWRRGARGTGRRARVVKGKAGGLNKGREQGVVGEEVAEMRGKAKALRM